MPSVCRIMDNNLLPASVPISTASKIAGLSFETFKARCISTGAVTVRDGRVLLAELAKLRGTSELLTHALQEAERLESEERDAEKLVEHRARRRAASQHIGSLARAARQVTKAQTDLIAAYGQLVDAAGRLVAVVP